MSSIEDVTYIEDYEKFREEVKRFEYSLRNEGREEGRELECEIQEQKQYQEKLQMAKKMKKKGLNINDIAELTGLSILEVECL